MNTMKIIEEISQVGHYLWEKGWAERNAGNISVNITELLNGVDQSIYKDLEEIPLNITRKPLRGNIFIITPTGSRMRDLNKNSLDHLCYIRINSEGTGYSHLPSTMFESLFPVTQTTMLKNNVSLREFPVPSSELPTHLAIHEMLLLKKPGIKTVIHTHATELIALTQITGFKSADSINRLLWGMHPETAMFVHEGAGFVPYTLPGTDAIAEATVRELENHPIVIWEKHGVFAIGHSVTEAFDTIDIMAKSAKIYFYVKQTGSDPEGLTEIQIAELQK